MNLSHLNFRSNLWRAAIALVAVLPVGVSAQHPGHTAMEMPARYETVDPHDGHPASPQSDLPREPIPPITPADRAAAFPEVDGHAVRDKSIHYYALFNRLETWDADPGTGLAWEGQGWVGTDLNRLVEK
jgi:copper resistance protein B